MQLEFQESSSRGNRRRDFFSYIKFRHPLFIPWVNTPKVCIYLN